MPAFQFANNNRVRKLGLEGGQCWAMIHDGALQLQDDAKHVVRIAPSEISRVRIGYFDAKRRLYHARIWRDSMEQPLELIPTTETWAGYRETIYEFAKLMTETNRLDRIETGTSKFDALFGPILTLVPTLGAIVLALFVLANEPWWGRMIVPIVPTLVFAILLWIGLRRHWPKPIQTVNDLEKQLPPI